MIEAKARGCNYLACDVIVGGLSKIVQANPLWKVLVATGLDHFVFHVRKESYTAESDNGVEQFEQMVLLWLSTF
jgi:hypothetical protein